MAQPIIDFRDPNNPAGGALTNLALTGTGAGNAVVAGQVSTPSSVRIYNNYAQAGGISDALNCVLAAYDDATHQAIAVTVPTVQTCLHASVTNYNGVGTNNDSDAFGAAVYYPIARSQKHPALVAGATINSPIIPTPTAPPPPSP